MCLASPSSQLQSLQMQTLQRYGSRLNYATWRKNATRVARKLLLGCKQWISGKLLFILSTQRRSVVYFKLALSLLRGIFDSDVFPPFIDITSISDSPLFSSFALSIYRYAGNMYFLLFCKAEKEIPRSFRRLGRCGLRSRKRRLNIFYKFRNLIKIRPYRGNGQEQPSHAKYCLRTKKAYDVGK